jgi:hypothetical protein
MLPLLKNKKKLSEPMIGHHDNITNPTYPKGGLNPHPFDHNPHLYHPTVMTHFARFINILF